MGKQYFVRTENGISTIEDATSGDYLSAEEFRAVLQELQRTYSMMQQGFTQVQYLNTITRREFRDLHTEADWIFPGWSYPEKKQAIQDMGPCVYFVRPASDPSRIRIACTTKLRQHLRALYWHSDKASLQIVAIARTDQQEQLAKRLQLHFDKYRIDGEWFRAKPVMNWVRNIAQVART